MSTFKKKKKAQFFFLIEQAHYPKPNINPKQQMEKQTQSKEKKQHLSNPTDGATPRILKKKKKKKLKPNIQSAD